MSKLRKIIQTVLDTTNSRVAADYDEIVKTVDIYKRLTAHLDGFYYQCSICVVVMPRTEYFLFSTPMTGQLRTGTEPYRNTEGAVENAVISINARAAGYIAEAVRTGTKPDRNIVFSTQDSEIVTDSDTKGYPFTSNQTGKAKAVRFSTLEEICKVLDCQPGDILEYRRNHNGTE